LLRIPYLQINAYSFGLAFLWQGLHAILLPALLLRTVPEALKNSYLGLLTFLGLIVAMVVQPLAGALSDRPLVAWGLRRPWILAGTLADFGLLALLGWANSYRWILVAYLLLQVSSNVAQGPAQALLPDLVPIEHRGLASGVKNLLEMLGFIAGVGTMGFLVGRGLYGWALALTALVLAALLFIVLRLKERPVDQDECLAWRRLAAEGLRQVFRPQLGDHPHYVRLLTGRLLMLLGLYAVQGFAQYFIRDVLHSPNPAATTATMMAAIGAAVLVIVYPAGLLADRLGCKPLNVAAGLLGALGIFSLLLVDSPGRLFACGALIGVAVGIFQSANWAWATDLIPGEAAGQYLGLSNLSTAGAGALARLVGPMIDGLNMLWPGRGYAALFVFAGLSVLAGTLVLTRVGDA